MLPPDGRFIVMDTSAVKCTEFPIRQICFIRIALFGRGTVRHGIEPHLFSGGQIRPLRNLLPMIHTQNRREQFLIFPVMVQNGQFFDDHVGIPAAVECQGKIPCVFSAYFKKRTVFS